MKQKQDLYKVMKAEENRWHIKLEGNGHEQETDINRKQTITGKENRISIVTRQLPSKPLLKMLHS